MNVTISETSLNHAYWFLFYNDELLVKEMQGITALPLACDVKGFTGQLADIQSLGTLRGQKCFAAAIDNGNIPEGFYLKKLRPLYGEIPDEHFWLACRAFHIINWLKTSRFCGCCGSTMSLSSEELAMKCSKCDHIIYPRVSPAIIVAVTKNNQLLLARGRRFPPNRYSVIAGFVEPGERLEDCVRREVKEEVGLEIHKIRYFGSQPWSFPDSLMIAFTAEYSTGDIKVDNQEIVAADWFSPQSLPDLPDKPSIGRQLIDWFIKNYKS